MSVIWSFLRPLIGPAVIIVLAMAAAWAAYSEGKSAGRASYADDLAACEKRRAEDFEKMAKERDALINERNSIAAAAVKKIEETKNENERLRSISNNAASENAARHVALDAALASLRFRTADDGGGTVPGNSSGATAPDGGATECRPCTDGVAACQALRDRAAHDAMTIFEWQMFYESIRSGGPEK